MDDSDSITASAIDECCVCHKRVYFSEKLVMDNKIYHKACLRCSKCSKIITPGEYYNIDGVPFCKPHFTETFKLKGKYESNPNIETVIRCQDPTSTVDEKVLPTVSAKSLTEMFRAKESEGKISAPTPISAKIKADKAREQVALSSNIRAPGLVNNQLHGDFIASEQSESVDSAVPVPLYTKSMVDVFKAMESSGIAPTPDSSKKLADKAREQSSVSSNIRLPGAGATISQENYMEQDANEWNDEVPEDGIVQKMLGQFDKLES